MSKDNPEVGEVIEGWEYVEHSDFFGPSGKLKHGALDEFYIVAWLNNPKSKTEALRAAAYDAGIEYNVTRFQAHEIHKRLAPDIEARLLKMSLDDKALGRSVLRKMCLDAESENVKVSAATTLAKGLYPDVKIVKDMTLEDINREIEKLEKSHEEYVRH